MYTVLGDPLFGRRVVKPVLYDTVYVMPCSDIRSSVQLPQDFAGDGADGFAVGVDYDVRGLFVGGRALGHEGGNALTEGRVPGFSGSCGGRA